PGPLDEPTPQGVPCRRKTPETQPSPRTANHPPGGSMNGRMIEVLVSPTGEVSVQTKGFAGSDCLQASKFLEQSLGATTTDRKATEFYQEVPTEQQLHQ